MSAVYRPRGLRQRLAAGILNLLGWKVVLEPPPGPKVVMVGYPHTSNVDFFYAILWAWATGRKMSWIGKRQLFNGLMGPIMRRLGGIPVDRDKTKNFVKQVAEIFAQREELWLVIAAEGTRSRADYWRSGFYYMALEAKVPIALAYLDYSRKEAGVGGYFMPSGDIAKDFEIVQKFYADKVGHTPKNQGPVQLKPPNNP
ncbi:MAG: lysophospholipid acyltransferase family protein [Deinococcota bacterium]